MTHNGITYKEERLSAEEYIDFLRRTDLGSQYPKERFAERIERLVRNVSISLVASDSAKPILIHCGSQPCDVPSRFLPFFREYPDARIILAHSNPVCETAELVNTHKNIFCDTACVSRKSLRKLASLMHNRTKILFGSDFPITHYWNTHLFKKTWTLAEEYAHDCALAGKTALLQ